MTKQPSGKTCKECGARVSWGQTPTGEWRLYDPETGKIHKCKTPEEITPPLSAEELLHRASQDYPAGGRGGGSPPQEQTKPPTHEIPPKCSNRDRLIVAQTLVKAWTELYVETLAPDEINFDTARQEILKAVEHDVEEIMRMSGV
jgi:hypothetical protein